MRALMLLRVVSLISATHPWASLDVHTLVPVYLQLSTVLACRRCNRSMIFAVVRPSHGVDQLLAIDEHVGPCSPR